MDSKTVNKAIAGEIRPLLKSAGFSAFSARTSWRFTEQRIDVINFQSFNSYLADALRCTTYSFSVNLGCYFLCIPRQSALKEKKGRQCPEEYDCHFRRRLFRSFGQEELERKDIWFIDSEAVHLPRALADVREQLSSTAFPWFENFSELNRVLHVLRHEAEDMDTLWGFGRNPSPIRSLMTGYVARTLGDEPLAKASLLAAAESGCFPHLSEHAKKG